jgi:hypothetical protein
VVCHYTSCKQAKTFGHPYSKPGDFYNNVKKSLLNRYTELYPSPMDSLGASDPFDPSDLSRIMFLY